MSDNIKCPVCEGEKFITFNVLTDFAFEEEKLYGCTRCGTMTMDQCHIEEGETKDEN